MIVAVWIPAFAGMTGRYWSGGAMIALLSLDISCKPIKGEGIRWLRSALGSG